MTYHIGKHVRVIAYQTENPHPGAVQLKHPQGIGLRIHRPDFSGHGTECSG